MSVPMITSFDLSVIVAAAVVVSNDEFEGCKNSPRIWESEL
jgi:hypothetical protein